MTTTPARPGPYTRAVDPAVLRALNVEGRPWYRVEAAATGGKAVVHLYDAIGGWFGVTARDFVAEINDLDVDEIELHINSPGGAVYDGIAIRNALRQHRAKVTSVVDGLAASAASFIALAGDEVVMAPNSELMIHDASGICLGWAADMRKMAEDLDRISDNIASMYADRAGGKPADWRALMLEETWYSADEAVAAGLADRVDREKDPADVEEAKAKFDLADLFAHAGRAHAPAPAALATRRPKPPPASAAGSPAPAAKAPGDTIQEGDAGVFNDSQLTTLRQTVGVADDADADTILAALTEALEERADPQGTPQGAIVLDPAAYDDLRRQAAAGLEARNEQRATARAQLVDAAVRDGRVPPARRDHWLALLTADPGVEATLAALQPGTVPMDELGHAEDTTTNDSLLAAVGWTDPKER